MQFFFQSFLEKSNIGCTSSNIYDIVAFLSLMPNTDNKLILVSKIKERWRVSSMTKLIGNGEKLCKLFANSRLIILERTRTCDSNFIYAIAQCCSFMINCIEQNELKGCKTLNDAVRTIENTSIPNDLYLMLSSHFTTYYRCPKCHCSPTSLSITHEGISIYEHNNELSFICGTSLTSSSRMELSCSSCFDKTKDVILPIHGQIHHRFPTIFMYYLPQATLTAVQDLHVELTDHETRSKCRYKPTAILLIDEYNGISVVKLDKLSIYCSNPYQVITTSSFDTINEAFHTAQKTLVFLTQVKVKRMKNS